MLRPTRSTSESGTVPEYSIDRGTLMGRAGRSSNLVSQRQRQQYFNRHQLLKTTVSAEEPPPTTRIYGAVVGKGRAPSVQSSP